MRNVTIEYMEKIIITFIALFWFLGLSAQTEISYTYDGQGRLISEAYDSVYKTQLTYDKEGNIISKYIDNYSSISNIKNNSESNYYQLYPNPAEEKVYIESNGNRVIQKLGIYDLTGRKLKESDYPGHLVELTINDLISGIYLVVIKSNGEPEILKFVKK